MEGAEALTGNYAIIAFHAPFCYGVGVTVMEFVRNRGKAPTQFAGSVLKAMFQNWLIPGIVLGFIVNVTGLPIPQAIDDALVFIIAAALPSALFALGGVLVQYKPEVDLRIIAYVVGSFLLIHPTLVWSFGSAFCRSSGISFDLRS